MHPLTQVWWKLFTNRTDGALRTRGSTWSFDPLPLTHAAVSHALGGRHPLGVYAVDAMGLSRWLCLDADPDAGQDGLVAMAATIEQGTFFFEPSRRGAHLWRFCPPTSWDQVREYGVWVCEKAAITCEVFPKGAGRTGVRLPLTLHPKSGLCYPPIDPSSGEILPVARLCQLRPTPLPVVTFHKEIPAPERGVQSGAKQTDFEALFREIS